jgi:hypothetical protein
LLPLTLAPVINAPFWVNVGQLMKFMPANSPTCGRRSPPAVEPARAAAALKVAANARRNGLARSGQGC